MFVSQGSHRAVILRRLIHHKMTFNFSNLMTAKRERKSEADRNLHKLGIELIPLVVIAL